MHSTPRSQIGKLTFAGEQKPPSGVDMRSTTDATRMLPCATRVSTPT